MATRILLIEDEAQIRNNVHELLTLQGFEVDTAANGREGISQALLLQPDLILCDIMMPEVDGFQVLKVVRNNRSTANVPFIFLTARAEPTDIRQGMSQGADDYLTKPFTFQNLLTAIDSRLKREEQRKADLQVQLDQYRNTITTVSTHEYNTSLTGIIGFSSILIEQYEHLTGEDLVSMAQMIKVCGLRLKRSLDNIQFTDLLHQLTPSHSLYNYFSSGQSVMSQELVENLVSSIEFRQDRKIACTFLVETAQLKIAEDNLKKCLEELLDNGIKFSDADESVSLSGQMEEDGYRFAVTNTGQPFDPADKERVAPFQQFGRSHYEQQGFGLGLAIVKRVVEMNQGRLEIDHPSTGVTKAAIWIPRILN
jgi:two-component system sensor histidine kinase/response regulator